MPFERDSYAYFTITSPLPLCQIEDHMGAVGDGRCWSIGDARKSPSRGVYRFSRWSLLSGVDRGRPFDEHLRSLWRRLSAYRPAVVALPDTMTGSIMCVGYFSSRDTPVSIASGHFSTAAYYGITFERDFYFDDNFGDEQEGQPCWQW